MAFEHHGRLIRMPVEPAAGQPSVMDGLVLHDCQTVMPASSHYRAFLTILRHTVTRDTQLHAGG